MGDEYNIGISTPVSLISTDHSSDTLSDDQIPSTLITEELQLALNKEATEIELEKAISRCKQLVLANNQCSTERKWLVRHLIELRLRLQECKEALLDPKHPRNKSSGVSKRVIQGHHLNLQPLLRTSTTKYCDHCTGIIWNVVQAWYQCEDCGYCCHHKCMSSVVRKCAHVIASERGCYELEICPETGLSKQKYQCAECKAPLAISNTGEARRCDYNGYYYCSACHWGSLAVIPARVVHNWDLTQYPVCQASLQQLKVTLNRPLINLNKINPHLFKLVHELDLVQRSRLELHGMRKYLLVCRFAKKDHLLWRNVDTPHLIDTVDLYSLQDLVNTCNGELITKLHNLSEIFLRHIKETCELCKGRAHICEICSDNELRSTNELRPSIELLFPFDSTAVVCQTCNTVYHKNCFSRKHETCKKCIRVKDRLEKSDLFGYDNGD